MVNLKEKIEFTKDVKRFAVRDLGIAPNDSFEKADLNLGKIYCFFAAPKKGEITASRDKYNAFYNLSDLRAYSQKIDNTKYDKYSRIVEAVGSAKIPIGTGLLKASKCREVFVILHEEVHIHLIENGVKLDDRIEESIANHFGINGMIEYFQKNHQSLKKAVHYVANMEFKSSLTNRIVKEYNKTCPDTIDPQTRIYTDIRMLEALLEENILRKDNSINKAKIQDDYVYTQKYFHVKKILDGTHLHEYIKMLTDYGKPILTLDNLREAVGKTA